jgi:hypothetical protein
MQYVTGPGSMPRPRKAAPFRSSHADLAVVMGWLRALDDGAGQAHRRRDRRARRARLSGDEHGRDQPTKPAA